MIHQDDVKVYADAYMLAHRLASYIGQELKVFEHKRRPCAGAALGLCYVEEKRIGIVIRFRNGKTWHRNRRSNIEIIHTITHEVAHLRHPNHGKEFKALDVELRRKAWEIIKEGKI